MTVSGHRRQTERVERRRDSRAASRRATSRSGAETCRRARGTDSRRARSDTAPARRHRAGCDRTRRRSARPRPTSPVSSVHLARDAGLERLPGFELAARQAPLSGQRLEPPLARARRRSSSTSPLHPSAAASAGSMRITAPTPTMGARWYSSDGEWPIRLLHREVRFERWAIGRLAGSAPRLLGGDLRLRHPVTTSQIPP